MLKVKLWGVDFKISFGFLFACCIFIAVFGTENAVLLLIALAIHELGHILCMFCLKLKVSAVSLSANGIKIMCKGLVLDRREFLFMAVSGCLSNLIFAVAFICLNMKSAEFNFIVGAYSMLPVSGFDGADVLDALFINTKTSKQIISIIYFLSIFTFVIVIFFNNNVLFWGIVYLLFLALLDNE